MKWKWNNNAGLGLCVVVLVLLCVASIMRPLHFQQQQTRRETIVKQRLLTIRAAEERYRQRHGVYTGDFANLVGSGLLADSLQYIPFSDGRKFHLEASVLLSRGGHNVPLMECSATYDDYLHDLNRDAVGNLNEEAGEQGRFPGLKIGSLDEPNGNAPSWE